MTGDRMRSTVLLVRAGVGTRLRSWLDPRTVDRVLALVLAVVAQLEVWLGGGDGADHNKTVAALVSLLATGSVAVRRRWPFEVGVVVSWAFAVQLAFWGDPQIIAASVAYFCALYALAVWTLAASFPARGGAAARFLRLDRRRSDGRRSQERGALHSSSRSS